MTNVPGPQQALYLAGAHVTRLMFWVPQSGDIGVGVSILSYDGGVQFGLIADRALCAHRSRSSIASSLNSKNWCSRFVCCRGARRSMPERA